MYFHDSNHLVFRRTFHNYLKASKQAVKLMFHFLFGSCPWVTWSLLLQWFCVTAFLFCMILRVGGWSRQMNCNEALFHCEFIRIKYRRTLRSPHLLSPTNTSRTPPFRHAGIFLLFWPLFFLCHIWFWFLNSWGWSVERVCIIDWLWIRRTATACRLLGEPAVQAPALLLLNWSPLKLGCTQTSKSHWKIMRKRKEKSQCAGHLASICSLYHFGYFFTFFYLISFHLQITISWGGLWVNHTSWDKGESTKEKMGGTNGIWLRTACWVIGFYPLVLSGPCFGLQLCNTHIYTGKRKGYQDINRSQDNWLEVGKWDCAAVSL